MPILELKTDELRQTCAACGGERTIPLGDLSPEETEGGERVLRLPVCSGCGSVELLIPQQSDPDAYPTPGGYGHLHRLLVDELDERIAPARASPARKAKRAKWFPGGFRLPAGSVVEPSEKEDR
jgi:hypothetical protein